jgi:alpha-beta hydrolase superfamily lysophospholipase
VNSNPADPPLPAGTLNEPLYFSSGDHQLFAWLHWPTARQTAEVGLVICKPFGYEAICAHRSMRVFAETAASLGMPALRFDYLGTGDAADGDPASDQIEPWLEDVASAVAELRRRTGVQRVCLLGFRLGALLATAAAVGRGTLAEALILVAPVLDGRRYLRELRTTALAGAGAANASRSDRDAAGAGSLEVGGYVLSAATLARLSQINVAARTELPVADILMIDRDDLPSAREWSATLVQHGARMRYVALEGFVKMMMTPPQFALVPGAMLAAMRDWLLELAGATQCAPAHRHPNQGASAVVKDMALAGASGAMLRERPVSFGSERRLFGILTEPTRGERPRRAVILLNSGADYHIGAGRMYVSMARRWADRGYLVLRMDLAGLGDSATGPGCPDDDVFPPAVMDDIGAAIDLVRAQYAVRDVTLGGLCSAAYHTLRAAVAGLPVNRILMVNPQNFSWKEGMAVGDLQLADVIKEIRGYRERAWSVETWKRLVRGQIDLPAVSRVYLHRARIVLESAVRDAARRLRIRLPRDLGWDLQEIAARGVKVVFVFARGEPGLELLKIQGGSTVARLGDRCSVHIIDSADHTFTWSGPRARLEQVLSEELFAPQG